MKSEKRMKLWLNIAVVFISVIGLMLLLYLVMVLSFQTGDESSSNTRSIAAIIAQRVYTGSPTEEEINAIVFMLRYFAHIALFFVVGLVTTFVSMVIFRNYFRILGVFVSGGACYVLAYYTEYYKQYIEGRHFQMTDVKLNWLGSIAGIACMVISYLMNKLLMKLSS